MKNVLLEEQLGRIKRLLNEKKTENTQTILSEQPIVPTLLKRFLGARVVSKMEKEFGDDVIKNLESLFSKSSANIIKDATGEVFILSRAGTKIPMKTISTGFDAVTSKKITADDLVKLLPSKLKDGTDFKVIVQNELKNAKPKPVNPGTSTTPKPKVSKIKTENEILQDLLSKNVQTELELKKYLKEELKTLGYKMIPKGMEGKYVDELFVYINKKTGGKLGEIGNGGDVILKHLKQNMSITDKKELFDHINTELKNVQSPFKQKIIKLFWTFSQKETIWEAYRKSFQIAGIGTLASVFFDLVRAGENLVTEKEFKMHFGMNFWTYLYTKGLATTVPVINVWSSILLAIESIARTGYDIGGGRKDERGKKIRTDALGGAPPSEDEVDFNDNK